MARAEKVAAVAEMTERFQSSAGAGPGHNRGLSLAPLGQLRPLRRAHATLPTQMARLLAAREEKRGGEAPGGADGQGGEAPGGADGQAGAEGEASADDQAG